MILWAHDLGILFIALSDCKGELLFQTSYYLGSFLTLKTEINNKLKTDKRVLTITPQSDTVYRCNIGVSGELSELIIHYHDINYGLSDMCKVAQKVCLHSERVSSTVIQNASNLPNMELTVHFGNYTNLSGVFPWQCRSSEFLSIRSHWRIQ
ncbi:dehydrodolichyl diphosphate syntase complex subunit NUS1, partial [Paragonimus westermani]